MAEMEKTKGRRATAAIVVALIIGASGFVYGTYAFVSTGLNPSQNQGAQNQPPSLAGCSITPGSANKTTTLVAVPAGASDPDGDDVTCFYRWYKNGLQITGQLGNALAPSNFVKGDVITVQAIPYDGNLAGTARNASTTILNSAPSLGYASISPANPTRTSTLQATPHSYSDADGDAPTYYYRWFRNGNRITGASAWSYVLQGAILYDEYWVEIKPSDGTANGTAANSSHAVIRWDFGGGYCAPSYNGTELFVSGASGVDAADRGNQTHPCQTITYGITQAVATGKARVIVAQGTYNESIDLADGKSVLGGYSQDFELFNVDELRAEVRATGQRWAVRGVAILHPTRVEGLVIHGPTVAIQGASSYGIYLDDCNASLVIANCTILGGSGGSGAVGAAGMDGQDGDAGTNGL
ncbi:MAG: DUF1565 domain-containing protein, partial [Candidatus Lokiarchaeota archaeon]|nr:DUF1565 domain-containing protein [Candidatus Lokiarchaeota archaeon]